MIPIYTYYYDGLNLQHYWMVCIRTTAFFRNSNGWDSLVPGTLAPSLNLAWNLKPLVFLSLKPRFKVQNVVIIRSEYGGAICTSVFTFKPLPGYSCCHWVSSDPQILSETSIFWLRWCIGQLISIDDELEGSWSSCSWEYYLCLMGVGAGRAKESESLKTNTDSKFKMCMGNQNNRLLWVSLLHFLILSPRPLAWLASSQSLKFNNRDENLNQICCSSASSRCPSVEYNLMRFDEQQIRFSVS